MVRVARPPVTLEGASMAMKPGCGCADATVHCIIHGKGMPGSDSALAAQALKCVLVKQP